MLRSAGRLCSVAEILFFALASSWGERYMVLIQWTSSDWKNAIDARCFFMLLYLQLRENLQSESAGLFRLTCLK